MTPLFTKLNLGAIRDVVVIDSPSEFEPELSALTGATIRRDISTEGRFLLAFVQTLAAVETIAQNLESFPGDATIWLAYPKGTSRRFRCEFNRDTGWAAVGAVGFEPVRQVAIDDDWSALRFRRVEFIRTLSRASTMALSEAGKRRTGKNTKS